jgi:prophage antirepressor-like protein
MREILIRQHAIFNQVRYVSVDGQLGLVASDVVKALGYSNSPKNKDPKQAAEIFVCEVRGMTLAEYTLYIIRKANQQKAETDTSGSIARQPERYR